MGYRGMPHSLFLREVLYQARLTQLPVIAPGEVGTQLQVNVPQELRSADTSRQDLTGHPGRLRRLPPPLIVFISERESCTPF